MYSSYIPQLPIDENIAEMEGIQYYAAVPFERNSPDKVKERHGRVQAWDQTSMNFLINGLLHNKLAFHIK